MKKVIKPLLIVSGSFIIVGGIGVTISLSNDSIKYEEKEYEKGKIIQTHEALFRYGRSKKSGCVITYVDQYGHVNQYDTLDFTNDACKNLTGGVEIEVTNTYHYSKRKNESTLIKTNKDVVKVSKNNE